jgi:hypothetical protein
MTMTHKTTLTLLLTTLGALAGPERAAHAEPVSCFGYPGTSTSCCWEHHVDDLGEPLEAPVWQSPSIISDDGGATRRVFVQGWDNAVWTRASAPGGGWSDWTSLGGVTTSRPTAVAVAPGHFYVFARGGDNAVWYRQHKAGVWGPWTSLGGTVLGGIGAAAWSTGEVEIYAVGTDKALWTRTLSGTSATPWASQGGGLSGDPSAARRAVSGGESIEVWAMAPDNRLWRKVHKRTSTTFRGKTLTTDAWGSWAPRLEGVTGAAGLLGHPAGDVTEIAYYVHDAFGTVWKNISMLSGDGSFQAQPFRVYGDVSAARDDGDSEPNVSYLDQDTRHVMAFSADTVCTTCGDGTCYGTESCSSCPNDCGPCAPTCGDGACNGGETCSTCASDCDVCPPPPPRTCQDYKFCLSGTTTITGYGCTIEEARKAAMKKVWGSGILADGACPPAPEACPEGEPSAAEWCCRDTGSHYYGIGCSEDEAEDAAKAQHENCDNWEEGWCD